MNFLDNIPPVTKNIILLNVAVFGLQYFIPGFMFNFGLHFFKSPDFSPYQLITHMFMHGGFYHILFNMYGVYLFGSALEQRMGSQKFFSYFLMTGFGAVLLHFASMYWESAAVIAEIERLYSYGELTNEQYSIAYFNTFNVTVGASGALFGVLAGFAMFFPNQRLFLMFIPVPIKAKFFVLFYAAYELYIGISNSPGDNIAHFAHLGGALFGYLIITAWRKKGTI
jgi:membrane associated rhomboid family serine protease